MSTVNFLRLGCGGDPRQPAMHLCASEHRQAGSAWSSDSAYLSCLVLIALASLLSACSPTWTIKDSNLSPQSTGVEVATVEQMETRQSPRIKSFSHLDLGVTKSAPTSTYNPAYSARRIFTPPGTVQIGVIYPLSEVYAPKLEFVAVAGHKYLVTWLCIPYPYAAVVDAASENIVGIDSYCRDCNVLLGSTLSSDSECVDIHMRPSWLHFDKTSKWFAEYAAWVEETSRQNLRDLCRAAEYGVTDAMMGIAFEYDNGFTYFPENDIRSYQWYRRASQSERSQGASAVKWFEDKILSPQQLEEAIRTLDAYETGQCENDLEFLRSHPQMYTVPSSK